MPNGLNESATAQPAKDDPSPNNASSVAGQSATIRVLMVEDDAAYARIAASILLRTSGANFEISLAATLREAQQLLVAATPDVILLDLTLPDSSGMNTVRKILEYAGLAPVVILTGVENEKIAIEALRAGAQDYIVKGGDPQTIVKAIRHAVERGHYERRLRDAESRLRSAHMQLIHAGKMESIGTLAAGIANEIRNPLALLQMGIERLDLAIGDKSTATAETIRTMNDAVQRATLLVKQLLAYAEPASTERQPANLHDILHSAVKMIDHEIVKRSLKVKEDLSSQMPPLLLNATAIEQCLINLLLNAAQASPDSGTITIRTRQTSLNQAGGDVGRRATDRFPVGIGVVQCEIDDEGPGLPPDVERRLFQPFFNAKMKGQAAGIGLCVSRNILELHGGKLEVYSRPAGGTRARITLVP